MSPMALGVALAPCLMRPPAAADFADRGAAVGADARKMHAVQQQAEFVGRALHSSTF